MAVTGCQSCLAGIIVLYSRGLTLAGLIPVTMKMHAADNKSINILGATLLRVTATDATDKVYETRQMTYIADCSKKFFLSREACVELHSIPTDMPKIGEMADHCNATETGSSEPNPHTCDCPRRQRPPPPPIRLPYPAADENREKLQTYMIDYCRSSTFNTCEHQPLPLMEGPPLELMIDRRQNLWPTTRPYLHHSTGNKR